MAKQSTSRSKAKHKPKPSKAQAKPKQSRSKAQAEAKPKASRSKAQTHPKLEARHKARLLEWMAAGQSNTYILGRLEGYSIPAIGHSALSYYRKLWAEELQLRTDERHKLALQRGLAMRAERVQRLCEFAEEVEPLRSREDDWGKLPKGRLYLQILAAIAAEMGDRRGAQSNDEEAQVKVYVGVDYGAI